MKHPDFAKWYFYQLLKDYEGEQLYLNELGYVYGNEEKAAWWWLRSPGYYSGCAAGVYYYGWVSRDGDSVDVNIDGVRPALHLNLQS